MGSSMNTRPATPETVTAAIDTSESRTSTGRSPPSTVRPVAEILASTASRPMLGSWMVMPWSVAELQGSRRSPSPSKRTLETVLPVLPARMFRAGWSKGAWSSGSPWPTRCRPAGSSQLPSQVPPHREMTSPGSLTARASARSVPVHAPTDTTPSLDPQSASTAGGSGNGGGVQSQVCTVRRAESPSRRPSRGQPGMSVSSPMPVSGVEASGATGRDVRSVTSGRQAASTTSSSMETLSDRDPMVSGRAHIRGRVVANAGNAVIRAAPRALGGA